MKLGISNIWSQYRLLLLLIELSQIQFQNYKFQNYITPKLFKKYFKKIFAIHCKILYYKYIDKFYN